ncbi:regulator of g protein signaling [Anaeramoeba flamelloides]|uniref:Regulator of g protein signaling n=1 Tax=Anaeramoeba flamelloides TaxID=1746091 RepID=A0ABQ8YTA8_9EUKA|nr:regulator of g protein signaling [Anaeramoeba flamelloides]
MGNFQPSKKIPKRKKKSFLRKLEKSQAGIAIINKDFKFLYANKSCFLFFGFCGLAVNNKSISDLKPKTQPHVKLENIKYALKQVNLLSTFKKGQTLIFNWVFQPDKKPIFATIEIQLIRFCKELAVSAMIRTAQDNKANLSHPMDRFRTISSNSIGSWMSSQEISEKGFSSLENENSSKTSLSKIKLGNDTANDSQGLDTILNRIEIFEKSENTQKQLQNEYMMVEIKSNNDIIRELQIQTQILLSILKQLKQSLKENSNQSNETLSNKKENSDVFDKEIKKNLQNIHDTKMFISKINLLNLKFEETQMNKLNLSQIKPMLKLQEIQIKKLTLQRDLVELRIRFFQEKIKQKKSYEDFSKICNRINSCNKKFQNLQKRNMNPLVKIQTMKETNDDNNSSGSTFVTNLNNSMSNSSLTSLKSYFVNDDYTSSTDSSFNTPQLTKKKIENNKSKNGKKTINKNGNEQKISKGITFDEILKKKKYRKYFYKFLHNLGKEQNLECYIELEKFKRSKEKNLRKYAEKIYAEYFQQEALNPIHIKELPTGYLNMRIETNDISNRLFAQIQHQIYLYMIKNLYSLFLNSNQYNQLIKLK